jgi:alkylation response protein AidB-like acyl-CoA dehydrogenase
MDFNFSEEHEAVSELAREILQREATPERIKAAEASSDWTDAELWQTLAEANLLGVAIPEVHGGMGFGFAELCGVLEAVGGATAPLPAHATLVLGALPIAEFGSEAQKAEWLPRVAAGRAVLTAALVDAESGAAAKPATTARREGDGFALDGRRCRVPFAAQADAILVSASTEDGVAVFLVQPDSEGVELEARVTSTGQPLYELSLTGVRVSADQRLGGDHDGAAIIGWLEERALVGIAALQAGVSASALEITAGYVKEREQFNVPIGSFQAVQHRCADAFIDLQALRWTLWRAAWRLSEGLSATREAWVAKFWAADAGSRIANSGLHLHGGLGSDVDYPIHRHFLWSKALELELGGAQPLLARLGRDMARTGPSLQESA